MTHDISAERQEELRARVVKGIAFLDTKRPSWALDIPAPDELDIQDTTRCVTAQLSGSFWWRTGMEQLGLTLGEYTALGFRLGDQEYDEDQYDFLTDAWKTEVFDRRTKAEATA